MDLYVDDIKFENMYAFTSTGIHLFFSYTDRDWMDKRILSVGHEVTINILRSGTVFNEFKATVNKVVFGNELRVELKINNDDWVTE